MLGEDHDNARADENTKCLPVTAIVVSLLGKDYDSGRTDTNAKSLST